jgi:hypothetical protein
MQQTLDGVSAVVLSALAFNALIDRCIRTIGVGTIFTDSFSGL